MINLENLDKLVIDDYIKDALIGFYQNLFYQNKTEFKFDPDKSVSRINICDQFSVDDLTPDFKPTIYIRRHPFSFVNTSIDQMFSRNLMTGSTGYSDLIAGSVEVVCVSSVELEACRLASIIFMVTNAFKSEICSKTGMFRVDVKALGEAQPLAAGATMKLVEVPVTLQLMFQSSWVCNPDLSRAAVLREVVPARSTNVVTGEKLTGIADNGCGNGSGVCTDESSHSLCIPLTAESPTPYPVKVQDKNIGPNCVSN